MFVVQDVLFQNILDLSWVLNVMEQCKVLHRANTYRNLGIEIINIHVDTRNSRGFVENCRTSLQIRTRLCLLPYQEYLGYDHYIHCRSGYSTNHKSLFTASP